MTTLPLTVARPAEHAHAAAQPLDGGFDDHDIAGMHRPAEADALHAAEEDQLVLVLGLRQDEDRANLSHGLGQDGWRQRRPAVGRAATGKARSSTTFFTPTIRLSGSNSVIRSTSRNGITVRQNPFDCRIVQRKTAGPFRGRSSSILRPLEAPVMRKFLVAAALRSPRRRSALPPKPGVPRRLTTC